MGSLLERYERDATVLRARSSLADVVELAGVEARRWNRIDRQLREDPDVSALALTGGIAGLEPPAPKTVNQTLVTGSATEQALFPTALMAIAAEPQVPKLYRLFSTGTSTTAATQGTYTFASRIGPAPTNASPLFGAVSGAFTPVASATAARWDLSGWVLVRTGGTAAIAVASFDWVHSATVGGGGPSSVSSAGPFGGISASFDSTLATTSLWIGVTHATSTTNTWTAQAVAWGSWN